MGDNLENKKLRMMVLKVIDNHLNGIGNLEKAENLNLAKEVEAAVFQSAFKFCKGNKSMAAKILNVNRGTFRTKLASYSISEEDITS